MSDLFWFGFVVNWKVYVLFKEESYYVVLVDVVVLKCEFIIVKFFNILREVIYLKF